MENTLPPDLARRLANLVQRFHKGGKLTRTALLHNKFENELPPILSEQEAKGIQALCGSAIDEVLGILHSGR